MKVKYFEKYLRGDIIRIIADDVKFAFWHDGTQIEFKKISFDEVQFGIPLFEVCHRLAVYLDRGKVDIWIFEEKLSKHTHTRSDFDGSARGDGLSNSAGDVQVRQEVLAKKFFGVYLLHCPRDSRP